MFAVHCKDRPGAQSVRADNRARHLAYLKANSDKVVMAGPVLDDDGQAMLGSLLVLDVAGRAELDAFLAGDPYAQADLFESVTVLPFRKVLP
ncbi:MAG: YciI family protein [Magnetospirillum sp.]|nr:YciI family protein [Magnetospirillum sp.]